MPNSFVFSSNAGPEMKILFVTWWPPGHAGFTWHFTEALEREMQADGVSVARVSGQALQPPLTFTRLIERGRFLVEALREASRADVLLAYMDSPPTRALAVLRRFGFLRGAQFVIADFWVRPPRRTRGIRDITKTLFLRHVYGHLDLILVNSEPGHELFVREGYLGPSVRTAYLPSAEIEAKLDQMDEFRTAKTRSSLPFSAPYFFAPGVSARDFESVFRVAAQFPDESFAIMTKGDVRSDLPPNVKRVPWGPYDEYIDILKGSRAVIIPMQPGVQASGMRTFHEAWGLGVPVIIGMSEGLVTYLDHPEPVAFTYEPGDAAGLRAAVGAVIDDPAGAREVADRARSTVRSLWSSRNYVKKLLPILHALLTTKSVVRARKQARYSD